MSFVPLDRLETLAQRTTRLVVGKAQLNLIQQRRDVTGKLSSSIKGVVTRTTNGIRIVYSMQDYGVWLDQGRDGANVKRRNPKSLFYKSSNVGRFPPPQPINQWIGLRRIKPIGNTRITPKALTYLISRKIYMSGIAPSMFFTDAYKEENKTLAQDLAKELTKDIVLNITKTIGNGNNSST